MKRILLILLGFASLTTFSGCGSIFAGHIDECQRHAPPPDQPRRKIRPAVLVSDILLSPFLIGVPIDFATGAMYKPCAKTIPPAVADSLRRVHEKYLESISCRDKFLTIFTDPFQGLLCEDLNIGIEHPFTKNLTIGFDFATVHPIGIFYVNPISPAQRDWPGTVYYGYDTKIELKYFTNAKPSTYIGLNLEYKNLWYNNVPFFDIPSGFGDEAGVHYTRDEKANVFGADVIFGNEFAFFHKALMVDCFIGFGLRLKYREINTYGILINGYGYSGTGVGFVTPGTSSAESALPTPIFGVKIGLNTYKKEQGSSALRIGQAPSSDAYVSPANRELTEGEKAKIDSATRYRKGLRIYTDGVQTILNEFNLGLEYAWLSNLSVGVNVGLARKDGFSDILDKSFYTDEGFSLITTSGYTGRLFAKWYSRKKKDAYWSFQLVYKSLWFAPPSNLYYNYSPFSIHNSIIGQDFVRGHEYWIKNNKLFVSYYYGIGFRERYSDELYTTPTIYIPDRKETAFYFTPIFDVNIGYKIFK